MSRFVYPVLISLTLAAGAILYLERRGEDPLAALLALHQAQAQSSQTSQPIGAGWPSGPSAGQGAYPTAPATSRPESWPQSPAQPSAPPYAAMPTSAAPAPSWQPPNSQPVAEGPTTQLASTTAPPPQEQPLFAPPATPSPDVSASMGIAYPAGPPPALEDIPNAQIIARIDSDVILAGDIYGPIDAALSNYRGKVPEAQLEMQRRELVRQALDQYIETKLLAVDARRNLPAEAMETVHKRLAEQFENVELPKLLKQNNVSTRQELDAKLRAQGTSLERRQRAMGETILAGQWRREKVKFDEEITHEQMLAYYQQHGSQFDRQGRVRWEQVTVRFSKYPDKATAFRVIAEAGNQIIDGRPLADVARAISDGSTASDGGWHDWTTQGSLSSAILNQALFLLPPGAMSPILEDDRAFHIVRVVERQEAGRQPFVEAQVDIRTRIREQRLESEMEKVLADLRSRTKVWTIFDGPEPLH